MTSLAARQFLEGVDPQILQRLLLEESSEHGLVVEPLAAGLDERATDVLAAFPDSFPKEERSNTA